MYVYMSVTAVCRKRLINDKPGCFITPGELAKRLFMKSPFRGSVFIMMDLHRMFC